MKKNFAHLLYHQGVRKDNGHPDSAIAVSSYKSQSQMQGSFGSSGNSKTVPVTSFPNGRVTTMLQNSYSNNKAVNPGGNAYSRVHVTGQNVKNYRLQEHSRQVNK